MNKIYYQWVVKIICKIFGHKKVEITASDVEAFSCARCFGVYFKLSGKFVEMVIQTVTTQRNEKI